MVSTTNDAVFQRRNNQIQDAIDAQNLKQALQLIEKRMKKGEDTRFLRAWKAHILFRHADEAHHKRGVTETLELCKAEPPATDLETLDILQQTLEKMNDQEDTKRGLWEKAAKAKPQELEIQMRWFTYAFENDDWKSAQKAAMSLQSNFPRTRKYYFWAIFLCHLTATDSKSSEAERKLFGTLAYRMASKAAESVPSDPKESPSPPKAIQTTEELLLLVKILETQDRHSEIVKLLDSESLGLNSPVVQNDWTFVGTKVDGLEKAGMWTEGLVYAKNLLAIPSDENEKKALQERDDWAVWNLLVASVRNINNAETTSGAQIFIKHFLNAVPKSRNAQLAQLDLIHWGVQSGSLSKDDLYSASKEYFDRNKSKLYCFGDLQKYLPGLEKDGLSRFVEYTLKTQESESDTSPFKGVAVINALKLEYCFQLSSNEASITTQKTEDYIGRCLKAYSELHHPEQKSDESAIESQPSDDLCLLAAMSLMRFGHEGEQIPDTALIRAAGILDRLLVDSPHNYQALLLLVRIYLRLGAGSLALKTFSKLSVKQFQFETVAHNLFTRIATVHPHSAPPIEGAEYKDFDPQIALMQGLNFYRNADITTIRNRSNGLDYGSYVNVEGTIDLQRRLKNSICRKMYALEVRRTQRLVGGKPVGRYDEIANDESPMYDQRKFDAFMNCEAPGKPTFEERMRLGPLPRESWMKSSRITDRLFGLLKELAAQRPVSMETALPSLDEILGSDQESDMTPAEIEATKNHLNLLKVVSHLGGSKSVTPEEVEESLSQMEEWLSSKTQYLAPSDNKASPIIFNTAITFHLESPSAPSWRFLHETSLILETLKAVSQLTTIASKKGTKSAKLPKDRIEQLTASVRQVHESVRTNIRNLKSRISESGVLSALIDLVLSGTTGELRDALEKMLDTSALEVFAGELMESWEEGLEGLVEVTL
ncbi:MDM20/NAA25 family protein [Aspergillus chevalieri]|uniref:Cytoskeleton organization protein n=1 Tax=Aspergillus chevalieri TaxID=182096 RepID=A0A7R7ZRN5_ASPCH|nr:uncharacterized protein ACHE_70856A [Aspergillus chevalieri]BCR92013.1 hypothetical protein ACHE_70856A [Aspergillus chevalieri]